MGRKDNKMQVLLSVEQKIMIEILKAYGIPPQDVLVKFNLPLPPGLKKAQ